MGTKWIKNGQFATLEGAPVRLPKPGLQHPPVASPGTQRVAIGAVHDGAEGSQTSS